MSWWLIGAVLFPALVGATLGGWQPARAAPCVDCGCKEVTFWQVSGTVAGQAFMAQVVDGSGNALGLTTVYHAGEGCVKYGHTDGQFNRWIASDCVAVCDRDAATYPVEMMCAGGAEEMSGNPRPRWRCGGLILYEPGGDWLVDH
ncbi:MAG: hypothetical protein ACRC33_29960 [Gemmataceae bacterium]